MWIVIQRKSIRLLALIPELPQPATFPNLNELTVPQTAEPASQSSLDQDMNTQLCSRPFRSSHSRRSFLFGTGASVGSVAFSQLLAGETPKAGGPLSPKPPMHPDRAKAVILLFMEGGPGQMETFDPKPDSTKLHKHESKLSGGQEQGFKLFIGSSFRFNKVGDAGSEMCDQWVRMADPDVGNELCNYRGCQAESFSHPEALYHMNTGSGLGGDPAFGSCLICGLGSENQNLPGYVVMTEVSLYTGMCWKVE